MSRVYYMLLCCICLAFSFFSTPLYAEPGDPIRWYIGAKVGYNGIILKDVDNLSNGANIGNYTDFLSTFAVGGTGGLQISLAPKVNFRSEIEYMYSFAVDSGKKNANKEKSAINITAHNILVNAYIDYSVIKFVSIYAGIGIGASVLELGAKREVGSNTYNASATQANFAWQAGIGTRVDVTEYIIADLNIRYLDLGSVKTFGNAEGIRMKSGMSGAFEVLLGVAYLF